MKKGGNPQNLRKGGKPGPHKPGAGRPPDEFKQWCRQLISNPKTRKFVEDLVTGEPIEEKVLDGPNGEPQKLLVSAPAAARLKALEYVTSYAESKMPQAIEHSGSVDMNAEAAKAQLVAGIAEFLSSVKPAKT